MAFSNNSDNPAPYRPDSPRSFYWLWGLIFGPIILFWQATEFWTQNASLHWPTVTGTVLESSGHGSVDTSYGHHPLYSGHIAYRYEINGTSYVSYQISLWSPNLSSWARPYQARRFVDARPVGSQVTVYYDPKQFGNAVLIPGAYGLVHALGMILGALIVTIAVVSTVSGIRHRRKLKGLLNAPDAQTRTVKMQKGDIERGQNALLINCLIATGFMGPAVGLLVTPLLRSPPMLLADERPTPALPLIAAAILCVLAVLFFIARAAQLSRSAECPLCGNNLSKAAVKAARCRECNAHIIFEAPTDPKISTHKA